MTTKDRSLYFEIQISPNCTVSPIFSGVGMPRLCQYVDPETGKKCLEPFRIRGHKVRRNMCHKHSHLLGMKERYRKNKELAKLALFKSEALKLSAKLQKISESTFKETDKLGY